MRVLILSDIHANLIALETVLSDAAGEYDTIWCLGDIVGYGPRPNECIDLMRSKAEFCVMGNHDWAVLGRPGVNVDDFNPQARQAVMWTRSQLTPANLAYLDELADIPVHPKGEPDILVTHASPREPVWEYILTPITALENFASFSESICFVGHTHKPAIFRWRLPQDAGEDGIPATVHYLQPSVGSGVQLATSSVQRLIVNPGSVGQPRDNDARAAYALFDTETRVWRQERVAYPIELTQNQMREAGLPKRLSDRLSFGW
ncbi:MAG: metallophosphoesterase family protein [Caldilineaceae bacterium]|nr:metallophosphoesterase family protein [Caldilineaceae bacterium]